MTIYQMECLLTLSELLNFTRAAETLNITQPALSRIITSIEDEVGVSLVTRTRRSVNLTSAGQSLCGHFRNILTEYKQGVEYARAMGKGKCGCVRIGFSSVMTAVILPELMSKMRTEFPEIDIVLYDSTQLELFQMIRANDLDLLFSDNFITTVDDDLVSRVISTQPLGVFLSKDHPLAGRTSIDIEDLRGSTLIIAGRLAQPLTGVTTTNSIIDRVRSEPALRSNAVLAARTLSSLIVMVDCNMGVALLPRQMLGYAPTTVKYIPVTLGRDKRELDISLIAAWRRDNQNPCLRNVLSGIDEILGDVF